MSVCELTEGLEKFLITRNGLIQQVDCLQKVRVSGGAKDRRGKKVPSLRVEVKGGEIVGRLPLNCRLLSS